MTVVLGVRRCEERKIEEIPSSKRGLWKSTVALLSLTGVGALWHSAWSSWQRGGLGAERTVTLFTQEDLLPQRVQHVWEKNFSSLQPPDDFDLAFRRWRLLAEDPPAVYALSGPSEVIDVDRDDSKDNGHAVVLLPQGQFLFVTVEDVSQSFTSYPALFSSVMSHPYPQSPDEPVTQEVAPYTSAGYNFLQASLNGANTGLAYFRGSELRFCVLNEQGQVIVDPWVLGSDDYALISLDEGGWMVLEQNLIHRIGSDGALQQTHSLPGSKSDYGFSSSGLGHIAAVQYADGSVLMVYRSSGSTPHLKGLLLDENGQLLEQGFLDISDAIYAKLKLLPNGSVLLGYLLSEKILVLRFIEGTNVGAPISVVTEIAKHDHDWYFPHYDLAVSPEGKITIAYPTWNPVWSMYESKLALFDPESNSVVSDCCIGSSTGSRSTGITSTDSYDHVFQRAEFIGENQVQVTYYQTVTQGTSTYSHLRAWIFFINQLPVLPPFPDEFQVVVEQPFNYTFPIATDDDPPEANQSVQQWIQQQGGGALLSWMHYDTTTFVFEAQAPRGEEGNKYYLEVVASDGVQQAKRQFQFIVINHLPTMTPIGDQEFFVGDLHTLNLAEFFDDPDLDPEVGRLTIEVESEGGGELSSFITYEVTTQQLTFLPKLGDQGEYRLHITATDAGGISISQSVSVTVSNRLPAVVGQPPNVNVSIGTVEMLQLADYYHDPDGGEVTIDMRLSGGGPLSVYDWVDFEEETTTLTIFPKPGNQGTWLFDVIVEDEQSGRLVAPLAVTVPNRDPLFEKASDAIEVPAGQPFFHFLPNAPDDDGDPTTFTLSEDAPDWVSINRGVATMIGDVPLAVLGTMFTFQVIAADGHGGQAEMDFTLTVVNSNDILGPPPRIVKEISLLELPADWTPFEVRLTESYFVGESLQYLLRLVNDSPLPDWASVSAGGVLTLAPSADLIGENFVFEVVASTPDYQVVKQHFTLVVKDPAEFVPELKKTIGRFDAHTGQSLDVIIPSDSFESDTPIALTAKFSLVDDPNKVPDWTALEQDEEGTYHLVSRRNPGMDDTASIEVEITAHNEFGPSKPSKAFIDVKGMNRWQFTVLVASTITAAAGVGAGIWRYCIPEKRKERIKSAIHKTCCAACCLRRKGSDESAGNTTDVEMPSSHLPPPYDTAPSSGISTSPTADSRTALSPKNQLIQSIVAGQQKESGFLTPPPPPPPDQ